MSFKTHELKCWPDFFAHVLSGDKKFEVRKDDRGFSVGDILRIREWDDRPGIENYTGREVHKRVTYLMSGAFPAGIHPLAGVACGWVVMSLGDVQYE